MVQDEEKSNKKFCPKRFGWFFFKASTVGLFVLLLVFAGFLTRLHLAPLDISFAKPRIETAINAQADEVQVSIEKIVLHWPEIMGPWLLGLQNVEIFDSKEHLLASLDGLAMSFSRARLFQGQIAPKLLIVKQPVLKIVRAVNGEFDIGFGGLMGQDETVETLEPHAEQTDIVEKVLEYIARPGRQAKTDSSLSAMEALQIQDAKIYVEDQMLKKSWSFPHADMTIRSSQEGLISDIRIDLPALPGLQASIEGAVLFEWESKDVQVQGRLRSFDTALINENVVGSEDNTTLSELAKKKIVFDADFNVLLNSKFWPKLIDLDFTGQQGAVAGINISVDADFAQTENSITGPLSIDIDQIRQNQFAPLWFSAIDAENLHKWLTVKFEDGLFKDTHAEMQLVATKTEQGWDYDTTDIKANFAFEDLAVNHTPPLPAVTNANGTGALNYDDETLSVTIDSAQSGGLTIKSAEINLVDIIKEGAAKADLSLKIAGDLQTAFAFLENEPIGFNNKFDSEQTKGTAEVDLNLKFPAVGEVKKEEIQIFAEGTVSDVNLPDVVKDLDLGGGPFSLKISDGMVDLAGEGTLDDRAVKLTYQTFLSSEGKDFDTKIAANIGVDEQMREQLGLDLSDFMTGTAQVGINYTEKQDGTANIDMNVDLIPAKVFVKPFDYEKLPGVDGKATLSATLSPGGVLQTIRDLKAEAPSLILNGGALNFRQNADNVELASGKIDSFNVNKTLATLEFEITPEGQVKLILKGQVVDLSPILSDDENDKAEAAKGYQAPPILVSVEADRMLTEDGKQHIKQGKIYADIDSEGRFNQLEMDGVAGNGQIYLRYKPDETGRRTFRLEADDAGSAIRVFGLYEHIVGGKLIIYGEPIKGIYGRDLRGRAEINNFKVINAPGLARLLGALSMQGFNDSLRGKEGLSFSKLESNFVWDYQTGGSILSVSDGRTSGNSLGLTFDGKFDQRAKTMDVSGTIVPLSGINKIVGSIPLIGNLLGGGDGLFAATYTMRGSNKEPEIIVNPLSVLAPGIIRKILFESSPVESVPDKKIQENNGRDAPAQVPQDPAKSVQ